MGWRLETFTSDMAIVMRIPLLAFGALAHSVFLLLFIVLSHSEVLHISIGSQRLAKTRGVRIPWALRTGIMPPYHITYTSTSHTPSVHHGSVLTTM
jgi:hypothetical protein